MEPMTVDAISLYNILHPRGYSPSAECMNIAGARTKVVTNRYIGQVVTENGNERKVSLLFFCRRRGGKEKKVEARKRIALHFAREVK